MVAWSQASGPIKGLISATANDSLSDLKLDFLSAISHATMRNIRQNLFLAFIYNAIGVPIAAGVLYPVFGLLLSPAIAAGAMALSTISVVGNALRFKSVKL